MRFVAVSSISRRLFEGAAVRAMVAASPVSSLLTVNGMDPCALTRLMFSVGRMRMEWSVFTVDFWDSATAADQSVRGFCHDTARRVSSWARTRPVSVSGASRTDEKAPSEVSSASSARIESMRVWDSGASVSVSPLVGDADFTETSVEGVAHGDENSASRVRLSWVPLDGHERSRPMSRCRVSPPSAVISCSWALSLPMAVFQATSLGAEIAERSASESLWSDATTLLPADVTAALGVESRSAALVLSPETITVERPAAASGARSAARAVLSPGHAMPSSEKSQAVRPARVGSVGPEVGVGVGVGAVPPEVAVVAGATGSPIEVGVGEKFFGSMA